MNDLTPMLASVATAVPAGPGWAFEPKYDGVRALAFVSPSSVSLVTRNGNDKAKQFPEVVAGLRALARKRRRSFVLDGEIVASKGRGLARFQALQSRIGEQNVKTIQQHVAMTPAIFVAFDLLLDGERGYAAQPWTARRARLERLLSGTLPSGVRLGEAQVGKGEQLLARARTRGWEGLIAKRTDSAYSPGRRSSDWQKLKVEARQEFVVGGWTEPRGSRQHLGALLLGYFEGGRFRYAGHTGGGFTQKSLREMHERLLPLERATSPFQTEPITNERPHWVRPEVVVEVKFNEWTNEGRLRQPIFLGVRDDKDARSVGREPESLQKGSKRGGASGAATTRAGSLKRVGRGRRGASPGRAQRGESLIDELTRVEEGSGDGTVVLPDGHALRVTKLDKIYFPRPKRTKGDVMRYYARVAPVLLPIIADRPLVLHRYPDGIEKEAFFQQNAPDDPPDGVRVEEVPSESTTGRRFVGGNLATLLHCVQLGAIAVNPWHSRIGSLEYPDYTVLDLDPGPRTPFRVIVQVARWLKDLLDEASVVAALKTSGSRGLHIVVPLPPRMNEQGAQLVAQIFAERVAAAHPREATTVRMRGKRPEKAVYVDFMQNVVGKSVASVFSVRAKPGATVSTPLSWDELTDDLDPREFTIDSVPGELKERARLWTDVFRRGNGLRELLKEGASNSAGASIEPPRRGRASSARR